MGLVNPKKIIVFPNTVKKDFYNDYKLVPTIKQKFSKNFVLLYLGNTSKRRGLEIAIDSLIEIKNLIPEIKLVIV